MLVNNFGSENNHAIAKSVLREAMLCDAKVLKIQLTLDYNVGHRHTLNSQNMDFHEVSLGYRCT